MNLKQKFRILETIGDLQRIRIIKLLLMRKLCVCELQSLLGLSISTVSHHLSILRDLGVIDSKKSGRWIEYYIDKTHSQPEIVEIIDFVNKLFDFKELFEIEPDVVFKVNRDFINFQEIFKWKKKE